MSTDPDAIYSNILGKASRFLSSVELSLLSRAYIMAKEAHGSQNRDSGERDIFHPLAVVDYLVEMRMDIQTIVETMLHDAVEDTDVSLDTIESGFGREVASLVNGVTKLGQLKPSSGIPDEIGSILGPAYTFDKKKSPQLVWAP